MRGATLYARGKRPTARYLNERDERQRRMTPRYLVAAIEQLFGGRIGLDPCTEADNPTNARRFYTPPDDGCALPWRARTVFVNPPYGRARDRWVERCIAEGAKRSVVLLIPAHTDTRTTQAALDACDSALFVAGRLRFGIPRQCGRGETATHPSTLFGFGVDLSPLDPTFGVCLQRRDR